MIEVKNLYKSFEDKDVLKDISTTFEDGKTNLIIGQSGSGKTVLMKNLVGLLVPTKGQVLYDGRDFVGMSKHEKVMMRREMGMIFQSAALFDSMTVLENVMFPLDMFSSMNYRERVHRAQECLDRVNLKGADEKFPGEISGGMQKRVAIARAIALNPKYLFCDEPNSGLDPKTSLVIDGLLQSITKEFNMTTIINTHDMNSVMGIGENIIFIYEGEKAWQGESSQIMESDNKRLTDFTEFCKMYLNTPPDAVTNKINPVGSRLLVITLSSSALVYPCPYPRMIMATTTAMVSATNGSPKKAKMGCTLLMAGTTFATELRMISTSGISTMPTITQNDGNLLSSISG